MHPLYDSKMLPDREFEMLQRYKSMIDAATVDPKALVVIVPEVTEFTNSKMVGELLKYARTRMGKRFNFDPEKFKGKLDKDAHLLAGGSYRDICVTEGASNLSRALHIKKGNTQVMPDLTMTLLGETPFMYKQRTKRGVSAHLGASRRMMKVHIKFFNKWSSKKSKSPGSIEVPQIPVSEKEARKLDNLRGFCTTPRDPRYKNLKSKTNRGKKR